MPPQVPGFLASLAITVVAVGVTLALGRLGKRKPHVASATVTALLLAYTIYLAEMLGRLLVMPRQILVIHLVFANAGALAFIMVVITGSRLFWLEDPARRRWHRRAVVVFIVLVLCTISTGTYLLTQSRPRTAASARSLVTWKPFTPHSC